MTTRSGSRRLAAILSICCAAAAITCDTAADIADLAGSSEDEFVKLQGPWPATAEGELEIADIQDYGGDDYLMSGWITTADGTVLVQALGAVLEAGGAEEGGRVSARVNPSAQGAPDHYDVVEIRRIP